MREEDAAFAVSDDAMRAVFQTFKTWQDAIHLALPILAGQEYADSQFEMYRTTSSTDLIANEPIPSRWTPTDPSPTTPRAPKPSVTNSWRLAPTTA